MRFNFLRRRIAHNSHLFDGRYIDPKALFVYYFDMLPNVSYITEIDMSKAYAFIRNSVNDEVTDCLQHAQFNHDAGKMEFNVTFIILSNARLIEVGSEYVAIHHSRAEAGWAATLLQKIAAHRIKPATGSRIGFATGHELNN